MRLELPVIVALMVAASGLATRSTRATAPAARTSFSPSSAGTLEAYRAAVRRLAGGRPALTDDAKAALLAEMKRTLPTDGLEFLVGPGADAVAAELASP